MYSYFTLLKQKTETYANHLADQISDVIEVIDESASQLMKTPN
jgi:hypothetical protein